MIADKNDKNIVRNAMIVLFLSLIIVYVIRYQTSGTKDTPIQTTTNTSISDSLTISSATRGTGTSIDEVDDEQIAMTGNVLEEPTDTQGGSMTGASTITINDEEPETITSGDMKILSGTTLYFGPIDGIDTLGISYSYALKDDKNIYFAYLESEPDISAIARSLGGTLYTMNTETEIVRNELFGKRIIFINLPEYKDKLVLMYVEIGQEKWLLQISHSIYHQSKGYLQNLFID